jgi:hypothetical protein
VSLGYERGQQKSQRSTRATSIQASPREACCGNLTDAK